MITETRNKIDEIQIHELIQGWLTAVRAKDVEALMPYYEPDILVYDLAPPLLQQGAAANQNNWQEWFASFRGPVGYEIHHLRISVGHDVAFSTSVNRISGMRTTGEQTDVWVRATVCYRKQDGQWLIAHEHASVPFYMDGSFKAAVDLTP